MFLSPRLQKVADLVPDCHTLADIGTDHGYIPLYLIRQSRVKHAIAADINAGPLDKARRLIEHNKLSHCIETRLGNGLSVLLPCEADVIVIAGMGGVLISRILMQGVEAASKAYALILQPMTGQPELRRWLIQNGYGITDEELAKEGHRIYEIIVAVPNERTPEYEKDIFCDIGWKLIEKKHPLLKEWVESKIMGLKEILSRLENGKTEEAAARVEELKEKRRQYEEVYHCLIK